MAQANERRVDASFSAENLAAGTVAVARDEHGDFIAAASWFIPHVVSVDAAEMIAIRNGFYLAAKIGCNILYTSSRIAQMQCQLSTQKISWDRNLLSFWRAERWAWIMRNMK